MRSGRIPLTYDECRARFRRAAHGVGVRPEAHALDVRGPEGQSLTIDVATLGVTRPSKAVLVLSGVHGVEGFSGSTLQTELLSRIRRFAPPEDMAVVVVHGLNPWGMAWWRRQNESNVDLNRNWRRSDVEPHHNDAYDELHALACPDSSELPSVADLFAAAAPIVAERGVDHVREAITSGQYRHPDGLHFGGDRTEQSNRILEALVHDRLDGVERLLVVDLHTGHGPPGEAVVLCDTPPGSPQALFLAEHLGQHRIEHTVGDPSATAGLKSGPIAGGMRLEFPGADCMAATVELGTTGPEEQLVATYQEQWVHRRADRTDPTWADVVWAYRCCFTPDDPEWEASALAEGTEVLDAALEAVTAW